MLMTYSITNDDLSAWSTANLLSFNLSKCKFMLVSHKRHPSFPSVSLHGVPIDRVTSYKYLGVLLSSDLSWSLHVCYWEATSGFTLSSVL